MKSKIPWSKSKMDTDDDIIWDEDINSEGSNTAFYMSKKLFQNLDDNSVLTDLRKKYPDFVDTTSEPKLRTMFLEILENDRFMNQLMTKFDLKIEDMFRIICRNYPGVFETKGYIKKIQSILIEKHYADL